MNKYILLFTILFGTFMRGFQAVERFNYSHDSDLAAWIMRDIVVDHHPRLIGQLTSQPGIFIGPLFYYALIPFYLMYDMDPVGTLWFGIALGILAIVSVYYVFTRLFDQTAGQIGAFLYASSWGISGSEREIVPTAPVSLWTIWFFYAVNLIFKGQVQGLYLAAVLIGLIWHLNLALILLLPIIGVAIFKKRREFGFRQLIISGLIVVGLSLPLIAFETRHDFSQTRSLVAALTTNGVGNTSFLAKLDRVLYLSSKNINLLIWQKPEKIGFNIMSGLVVLGTIWAIKLQKNRQLVIISGLWIGLYLLFFSFHSIIVSEYYLHGMNIIWLIGLTLVLVAVKRRFGFMVIGILAIFALHNMVSFVKSPINRIGYLEKTAIVNEIYMDAKAHNYPCVAVSYMTDPGHELGYRYLFWRAGLHVNRPLRESPVYTIVFPHTRANKLDQTFGALGLVKPDYSRYTMEAVEFSCSGENENLTEPMFGFTK